MCRFIAYLGQPLILDDVLFKPKNSLIRQSIHARELDEPLNGDGFGVGWYVHDIDDTPALFKSIQPAWSDQNLKHLSTKIRSECFLAHVRAVSLGDVSLDNTHPFVFNKFIFMHNGDIGEFEKIKRYLRRELTDEIYDWLKGQTDSEHLFGLFLNTFMKKNLQFTIENAAIVLRETIFHLEEMRKEKGLTETSYINAVISDGKTLLAVRYVSDPEATPASLYYSYGSRYVYHDGACHMHPPEDETNGAVLIASEKLTSSHAEWHDVPHNHLLLVNEDLSIELQPI